MGLFDKKDKEEIIEEEVKTVTELDKLKTYIKKNSSKITDELSNLIENNYLEGITDYKKCKEFIDICLKYDKEISTSGNAILEKIYELIMNFENTNITYNLINLALKNYAEKFDCLNYMIKSRSYFTDPETWAARVYEVFNGNMDKDVALKEDKMRIGIYPDVTDSKVIELNKKLQSVQQQVNFLLERTRGSETKIEGLKKCVEVKEKETVDNINSTFKSSINEIQNFTKDSIDSIKRILNANPSSTKEILTELEKQFNVIEAFDDKISIKERYEKLISLKNSAIIYHPKFDEVLKYVLTGKTVCLSGPNKCGKTNLAKQLAELLNLSFNNIGNIHDEVVQIIGHYDLNTNYNKPKFQQIFENGGIALIKNIDTAPMPAIYELNNIISNFSYNPYIFGDKTLTTPNKNFRLIMTNNNGLKIDNYNIDNLVTINLDYDINYENSLSNDKNLLEFLHSLRSLGLNITTSTFIDVINNLNTGLFDIEELIINYIISNNPKDLLKRKSEEISSDNKYNNTLKKILKG